MHYEKLAYMLLQQAERLKELAGKLGDRGNPLSYSERLLCRASLVPVLEEQFRIALSNYLLGDTTISILEGIDAQLKDLEVL